MIHVTRSPFEIAGIRLVAVPTNTSRTGPTTAAFRRLAQIDTVFFLVRVPGGSEQTDANVTATIRRNDKPTINRR